ncbi:unnamed protein product, partial [Effrenium voratum]
QTVAPSIWSTAAYAPLAKSEQLLLTRPGKVEFFFPGSFKQGGEFVQVSEVAEVHMIAAYDSETGRCFGGIALQAHPNFLHKFSWTVQEVHIGPKSFQEPEDSVDSAATPIEKLSRQCSWMSRSPSTTRMSPELTKSASRSSGLTLEKFGETEEQPTRERYCSCILLYAVKEGVLVHFADDLESCEEVVRSVQFRYRDANLKDSANPHPEVKVCRVNVGGAPSVAGRLLTTTLQGDLQRQFKIAASVEQQKDCTNCVTFSMRVIKGFQMALRGFDVVKACESTPFLGRRSGDVSGEAWERLWHRV